MAAEKMTPQCKTVQGKVPGPANYLLCTTHNHIVDTKTKTVIAKNLAEYKATTLSAAMKKLAGKGEKMKPDCKPVAGKLPGLPANIQLCATHGEVLDIKAKLIIGKNERDFEMKWANLK
jgi:hypothetical protein